MGAEGLEPSSLAAYAPEAYAYTNSATHPPFVRDKYTHLPHLSRSLRFQSKCYGMPLLFCATYQFRIFSYSSELEIYFASGWVPEDGRYHICKPLCSLSTISAPARIPKCFDVALNEILISFAISPTDASFLSLKYLIIASRRLLASALRIRSVCFIPSRCMLMQTTIPHSHLYIPLFARIRDIRTRELKKDIGCEVRRQ